MPKTKTNIDKLKVLFIYHHEYPHLWFDGLHAALIELSYYYDISLMNLHESREVAHFKPDFILGWGAFGSPADKFIRETAMLHPIRKGLCIAGNTVEPIDMHKYDVLFYETDWYKPTIEAHPRIIKAFGINSDIYKPMELPKIWDTISVGAFALWKRHQLVMDLPGDRFVVGEIQKNNLEESALIIGNLMQDGIAISDMVSPMRLSYMYNSSKQCYIPASLIGGGERAIWEARACGIKVSAEIDNPKLQELLVGPVMDHRHYAMKLNEGITQCLAEF